MAQKEAEWMWEWDINSSVMCGLNGKEDVKMDAFDEEA